MFNQVLKQLWNARRSNAWIWAVLLVVSVLLWFALDIIYIIMRPQPASRSDMMSTACTTSSCVTTGPPMPTQP